MAMVRRRMRGMYGQPTAERHVALGKVRLKTQVIPAAWAPDGREKRGSQVSHPRRPLQGNKGAFRLKFRLLFCSPVAEEDSRTP